MKIIKLLFISFPLFFSFYAFSQYDTIFSNDEKIVCTVKEITPEAVKYCYPNEDLINSVFKNTIQKIIFKSGRVQVFAESINLKTINSVDDYENVSFSRTANEVAGLYKLGEVGAKAAGNTALSNMEKVKERAERKVKIQAAMLGANVVLLNQFATTENRLGTYYTSAKPTSTNIAGIAYSNKLPVYDAFVNLMNNKLQFMLHDYEVDKLSTGDYQYTKFSDSGKIIINKIYNEDGFIMLDAHVDGFDNTIFRVINFSNDGFTLECSDNADIMENNIYNIRVKL